MEKDGSVPIGRILWIDESRMLVMMDGKGPIENRPENGDLKYTMRETEDERVQIERCPYVCGNKTAEGYCRTTACIEGYCRTKACIYLQFRYCRGNWTYCDGDCRKCEVIMTDYTEERREDDGNDQQ